MSSFMEERKALMDNIDMKEKTIEYLQSRVAELEKENAKLQQAIIDKAGQMCAYCGELYDIKDPNRMKLIQAHMLICEKHPMHALAAENARLRANQYDPATQRVVEEEDAISELSRQIIAAGIHPEFVAINDRMVKLGTVLDLLNAANLGRKG